MADNDTGKIGTGAAAMSKANIGQIGAGLVVQTYCNGILGQPKVDFSKEKSLKKLEQEINAGLATAQNHANNYLNTLQPEIITNMGNIGNYFQLNKALPATLPEGSTEAQWTAELNAVLQASQTYQRDAAKVVQDIENFHAQLSTDAQDFHRIVTDLNSTVDGDHGVLAGLESEVHKINKEIGGAIAGAVVSGLAIVGGAFLICVGSIADFVTAGTLTGVVLTGAGIVVSGVAGEVGSVSAIVSLNHQKASVLQQESQLKEEVKLASGVSTNYTALVAQVQTAMEAATAMENAWNSLVADIGGLITDLKNGVLSADEVRTLFVNAANAEIGTVLTDIATIKTQMAGVQVKSASNDQTLDKLMNEQLKEAA